APLAQCAPRLIGESNTGSWRTQTPLVMMASMAQPTEQCVHTVRPVTVLPALPSWAWAWPIMFSGSWLAKAAAPAVMPVPFRKERRSTVFCASARAARASGVTGWADPSDLRVSSMAGSSDFGGLVVLPDVRGGVVALGLRRLCCSDLRACLGGTRHDGRGDPGTAQAGGQEELAAIGGLLDGFHCLPPIARLAAAVFSV